MFKKKKNYYEMQKINLLFPNESYINSESNINKADLVRMTHIYEDTKDVIVQGGAMLDIGCNDGFFMRHFNWPFSTYVGIDMFSISEYLHTDQIAPYTKNGKITYITGLFEQVNLDQKFDFVFAGEIIEHVEKVKPFLKTIDRYLAEDGYVCFTTPNNVGKNQPEHYRQYNKTSLEKELKNFFEIIKIEELPAINSSWPFLYAKCKKYNRGDL